MLLLTHSTVTFVFLSEILGHMSSDFIEAFNEASFAACWGTNSYSLINKETFQNMADEVFDSMENPDEDIETFNKIMSLISDSYFIDLEN